MPFATHDSLPNELNMAVLPNHDKDGIAIPMICDNGDEDSSQFSMSPREELSQESEMCLRMFENWTQLQQTEFVEQIISRMSFHQHEHIYSILMPMLQRDFITVLPSELCVCELCMCVCVSCVCVCTVCVCELCV